MRSVRFLSLMSALPLLAAASSPPVTLQPASPWVVDYADQSCRLLREFGSGTDSVKLVFEKVAPRASASMLVVGPGVPEGHSGRGANVGTFSPFPSAVIEDGQSYNAENKAGRAILWQSAFDSDSWLVDPEDPELKRERKAERKHVRPPARPLAEQAARREAMYARAAKVVMFAFRSGSHRAINLATGPMDKPMRLLDKCTSDGLADWGIDPKVDAQIVRPATSARPAASWFTGDDYPEQAIRDWQQSDMTLRVNVDAVGNVTDCHLVSSVNSVIINNIICGIIRKRGHYLPAELADGTKVADYQVIVLKFRLPS